MASKGAVFTLRLGFDDERGDSLYEDTGCRLAPSCLSCPFPVCRHDRPQAKRRADDTWIDPYIIEALNGRTFAEAAAIIGCSVEKAMAAYGRVRERNLARPIHQA